MFSERVLSSQRITLPPPRLFCTQEEIKAARLSFESRFIEDGIRSALENLKMRIDSKLTSRLGELMLFDDIWIWEVGHFSSSYLNTQMSSITNVCMPSDKLSLKKLPTNFESSLKNLHSDGNDQIDLSLTKREEDSGKKVSQIDDQSRTKGCQFIEESKIGCKVVHSSKDLILNNISFEHEIRSLVEVLNLIKNPEEVVFYGKKKGKERNINSRRRSRFIGVCRNGGHWQALISINKKKTYIGTYTVENEAARAYDFYWMLVHWMSAKTNFSYTKSTVLGLINEYYNNLNSSKV